MVAPALDSTGGDAFAVVLGRAAGQVGTAEEAFTFIKSALARDTHRTWYGTIEERLADRLNHEVELRGSSLRARQRQVKQWLCIEVVAESGLRCEVMSRYSDDLTIGSLPRAPSRIVNGSLKEASTRRLSVSSPGSALVLNDEPLRQWLPMEGSGAEAAQRRCHSRRRPDRSSV